MSFLCKSTYVNSTVGVQEHFVVALADAKGIMQSQE